ncbi:MAG: peptidase U32 family protein [Methanomassiliicoccales archaeon]
MVELVAPAGSKESLKAAILGGANSVYLGGRQFGARRFAENFSPSELKGAIKIAHENNVKVYATVNVLIKEKELASVLSYIDFLVAADVDALIIQDRGLLKLIKDHFSIPIHASTQMNLHSPECLEWAKSNGIKRVILARELSLQELLEIRNKTSLELEVFVHGALCYSYSGQCLFSSILGGRSGNRGMCAQPCRKKYKLGNKEGYLLSTADLWSTRTLTVLVNMGINAFKIEGRMRSPLYAYLTSRIYSNAIGRIERGETDPITEREKELLQTVFSRGFTNGYLVSESVMQTEYANSRGLPLGIAIVKRGLLSLHTATIRERDGITLYKNHEKIGGFEVKNIRYQGGKTVLSLPLNVPDGRYFAYKTKDRTFDNISKIIGELEFEPIEPKINKVKLQIGKIKRHPRKCELSFYISSIKSLERVLKYATRIYFEGNKQFDGAKKLCEKSGVELVFILPRISSQVPDVEHESIMACTIGQLHKYKDRKLYGHYSLNFFNSLTLPKIYQYTISVELNKKEIQDVLRHYDQRVEILAFGKIELMVSKDPSLPEGLLIDERDKKFEVFRDSEGLVHILNSSDLLLLDYVDEIEEMGIDSIGIDLRRRDAELCELVARAFYHRDLSLKRDIKKMCKSLTSGHYLRGVK